MRKSSAALVKTSKARFILLPLLLLCAYFNANSSPLVGLFSYATDTVPDISFETGHLAKGMKDLKENLHNAKERVADINWDKIEDQVNAAMSKVNKQMIEQKMELLKQQIDLKKMKEDLSKIDFEKIQKDVAVNLDVYKKIDWEKMQKNIDESIAKVDFSKVEADLKKAGEKLADQKKNMKVHLDAQLKNLDIQLDKVQHQLKNMQRATEEMQKDGLIDKDKNHRIEFKSGDLYIDDKKQPAPVSEKYRKYFDRTSSKRPEMNNSEAV